METHEYLDTNKEQTETNKHTQTQCNISRKGQEDSSMKITA